jgi:hypothetical protein
MKTMRSGDLTREPDLRQVPGDIEMNDLLVMAEHGRNIRYLKE